MANGLKISGPSKNIASAKQTVLGPLLFLTYINSLMERMANDVKLLDQK